MSDAWYDVMQVCLNGHTITDSLRSSPEFGRRHCPQCGEPTIHKCLKCNADIPGDLHVPGVLALTTSIPKAPLNCGNCGVAFPWAKKQMRQQLGKTAQQAIDSFDRQLEQLQQLRNGNGSDPAFVKWRDTTTGLFERFAPQTPHFRRYKLLKFRLRQGVMTLGRYREPPNVEAETELFSRSCEIARQCITGVIEEIERFDIVSAQPDTSVKKGHAAGVHQEFHGTVNIQAQQIAAENAMQTLTQTNNQLADNLRHISALLEESEELTRKDQRVALEAIQNLSEQAMKKEGARDKSVILENGKNLLAIADKAVDVAKKLAPYLLFVRHFIS